MPLKLSGPLHTNIASGSIAFWSSKVPRGLSAGAIGEAVGLAPSHLRSICRICTAPD